MIEQEFNYANHTIKKTTDFFETSVENLETRKDNKKSSTTSKKEVKESYQEKEAR